LGGRRVSRHARIHLTVIVRSRSEGERGKQDDDKDVQHSVPGRYDIVSASAVSPQSHELLLTFTSFISTIATEAQRISSDASALGKPRSKFGG
jgi:hypothetical protein